MIVFAIIFAMLMRHVNGITTFKEAALTIYGLWLVVDWYDFLVMDILLAPFDKFYQKSGVSAFDKSAVLFHFKGSMKDMVLGLVCAVLVGHFQDTKRAMPDFSSWDIACPPDM